MCALGAGSVERVERVKDGDVDQNSPVIAAR